MSRGSSTRSLYFPDGNPEAKLPPFCVLGNTLLCRCIVLIRLVTFNGCQWLLEQPGSSLVPKCVRMTRLAADTSVATPISICGHGLVCSCIVVLGFTSAKHDSSDVHLRRCCHYPYPFFLILTGLDNQICARSSRGCHDQGDDGAEQQFQHRGLTLASVFA